MQDFILGQRWISDAELQNGLGTVLSVDHRTVTLVFLATGETRTYAKLTAPLTRVEFAPGDDIKSHEGWGLRIDAIEENDGLLTYHGLKNDGSRVELAEGELDSFIQLNRPSQRLFNGQIDKSTWFELRYQTLLHAGQLAHSELRGLTGGRTSPIPHQLYIAHEVASRYAPRVLLADEVGLGKTIEAGLILHHQLLTERARRVLIVLPESLIHQWLVEMLRRFNLRFSILGEKRCQAIEESGEQANPYHSEQLIICDLDFLVSRPQRLQQALDGDWDLLVVDEAHHLQWTPEQASPEYLAVEQLAARTRGVLLLTATPEQLGKQGHFARLRLLDPDRFPNFEHFLEEEKCYQPIAETVQALLGERPLDEHVHHILQGILGEGDNRDLLNTVQDPAMDAGQQAAARTELVEHLLDRHGTGRVLFRNTRAAVKGFPQRELHRYPLPLPEAYREVLAAFQTTGLAEPQLLLCPELLYQAAGNETQTHWSQIDPRVTWLSDRLKQLRPGKVLVITASADTALDLAQTLLTRTGLHAAVFHEGMSIIERDRAAAYFADQEFGTQVLICSEIGSEGRNFQFAHHLVLFDLPLNPDLLEQRIGRLDRIGQTETIQIHLPYLKDSAQAVMAHWYHQGLNAFEHTCPAGHSVFVQLQETLIEALHQIDEGLQDLSALIDTTHRLYQQMNKALQHGRDRLLEYNSCRPHMANRLRAQTLVEDETSNILDYLDALFDCFGVDSDEHTEHSFIIRPSEHIQSSGFPGLPDEGMTITCNRDTALANEDIQFITWEHPMITGAMEMILSSELGNTAVTSVKYPGASPGSLMLECLYILESASSSTLQSSRYLPPTTIRVVIDTNGKDHTATLSPEHIIVHQERVNTGTANKIVRAYTQPLRDLLKAAEELAQQQAPKLLKTAHRQIRDTLLREIDRLKALRQVNPNVRDDEIEYFENEWKTLDQALDAAGLRLDAQRVIITT